MTLEEFRKRFQYSIRTDKIGGGSFGSVYKVYDNLFDTYKALKIGEVKQIGGKEYSLTAEYAAVSGLRVHRNIANYEAVHQFETDTGIYDYAIMQYYPDGNLAMLLRDQPLSIHQKLDIGKGILKGIGFLHSHRVLHRDLKPSNILISKNRNQVFIPKITDFGLSKLYGGDSSAWDQSFEGGTIEFTSPEQLKGEKVSFNSDLWSYGVLLFELFEGRKPFYGGSIQVSPDVRRLNVLTSIINGDKQAYLHCPKAIQDIIDHCLIVDSSKRVKSFDDIITQLDALDDNDLSKDELPIEKSIKIEEFETDVLGLYSVNPLNKGLDKPLVDLGGIQKRRHQEKLEAERKAREEAQEQARLEAERKAREEVQEQARLEAEQKAREESEEQARLEAEQKAREEAKEQARLEAEQKAREEAKEQARLEAEQKAREKAEEQARLEAEQKAKEEAKEQARLEAEQKAREKAEEQARLEAEQKAREESEEQAKLEAEQKAKEEAEEQTRLDAERKAREEAEEQTKLEAEQKAREVANEQARLEAEQKAKEEAEELARIEAERKAREEAEKLTRKEANPRAEDETKSKVSLDVERGAKELSGNIQIPDKELNKKKNSSRIFFLIFFLSAILAIGYKMSRVNINTKQGSNEMSLYHKVVNTNTKEGFEDFLSHYPSSKKAEEIQQLLDLKKSGASELIDNLQPLIEGDNENKSADTNSELQSDLGASNENFIEPTFEEGKTNKVDNVVIQDDRKLPFGAVEKYVTVGDDSNKKVETNRKEGNEEMRNEEINKEDKIDKPNIGKSEKQKEAKKPIVKNDSDNQVVDEISEGEFSDPASVKASDFIKEVDADFVKVRGGRHMLGCDEKNCGLNSISEVSVNVDPFYISKYEVTQKLYREVTGKNPSFNKASNRNPVENVTLEEIFQFLKAINSKEGNPYTYRLPTEAEWEIAALGGSRNVFAGGNDSNQLGNIKGASSVTAVAPVGKFKKNQFQISDMVGNIAEVTMDVDVEKKGRKELKFNVVKGGSWRNGEDSAKIKSRDFIEQGQRETYIGFRLVRE